MKSLSQRIRNWQRKSLDFAVRHHPNLKLDQRAEFFTSLFEPFIAKPSQILDIGGGWGFYDKPLRSRGHSVTVLDVMQPAVQKAPIVIYSGQKIPFDDESFDVSLLVTVLHHISDYENVLREAFRVSRNYVIVVEDLYKTATGKYWTKWRDQIFNFEYFGHPGNFHSKKEWDEIFAKLNFSVENYAECYTWLSGLRILNGVFVLKPQRRPL